MHIFGNDSRSQFFANRLTIVLHLSFNLSWNYDYQYCSLNSDYEFEFYSQRKSKEFLTVQYRFQNMPILTFKYYRSPLIGFVHFKKVTLWE
jgi:hypothetical protein